MSKPVESVTYVLDDGREAFALVVSRNVDDPGTLNLAVLDPDTYSLHAVNRADPTRVK